MLSLVSDKASSYETVRRWRDEFLTDTCSVKDAVKSGQPVTATYKASVSKDREIIESDGRYTRRNIAIAIAVFFILRVVMQVQKDTQKKLLEH